MQPRARYGPANASRNRRSASPDTGHPKIIKINPAEQEAEQLSLRAGYCRVGLFTWSDSDATWLRRNDITRPIGGSQHP